MQPPRLQPLHKELESAFYHNAPAWVDIPYYFGSGLNYSIYRYMPGQQMRLPQGDEYHLRYCLEELFDGEHYPISLECPLTVLLVIEDDVERGFMLPEPIAPRPLYISEYVLKQYDYYFTYRRKNRETMIYDNWDYFPYLRKYERYEIGLLNYADNTSYRYTVVTKDDPERGWVKAVGLPPIAPRKPSRFLSIRPLTFY